MLEGKYTRRLSAKDLLTLGALFELKAAKFYRFMAKYFEKDPQFKEMMIRFAQDDLKNGQSFKKMMLHLEENPNIYIDEADYQHMRMLMPEHFIAMDLDHPEMISPKDALYGVLKFEEVALNFGKNLMLENQGINRALRPTLELVEMIRAEERHLGQVKDYFHRHYPAA